MHFYFTTWYHPGPTKTHNVPQCTTMYHNVPQCTYKGHNVEVNDITDSTNYFNPTSGGVGVGAGRPADPNFRYRKLLFAIQKSLKMIEYTRANFPKIYSHTF